MPEPRVVKSPEGLRGGLNESGTDIGAFLVVSWDTTFEQVVLPAAQASPMAGVTTEVFTDGDGVRYTLQTEGMAKCTAGAAISIGDEVMPETTGKVNTRTGTKSIVGTAKTAAAADGDIVEVELKLQVGA